MAKRTFVPNVTRVSPKNYRITDDAGHAPALTVKEIGTGFFKVTEEETGKRVGEYWGLRETVSKALGRAYKLRADRLAEEQRRQ